MPERTFSTVSSALFLAVLEASFNLPDTSDMAVSTGWSWRGGLYRLELAGTPEFADSSPILRVRVSSYQHAEGRFGSPQSPRILREASPVAPTCPACSAGWGEAESPTRRLAGRKPGSLPIPPLGRNRMFAISTNS